MLQYILGEGDRWSVGELAQMAVEGGCLWISIHLPEKSDFEIKEVIDPDVIEMCKEASVFLTIDDRPQLARELGLHGVRLSKRFFLENPDNTPVSLREELGPEAVIGIELTDPSALPSLVAADLDFITLSKGMSSGERINYLHAVKATGIEIPVVAEDCFSIDEALEAVADGCAGVAVGHPISSSHDPVTTMQEYIDALTALTR